MARNYSNVTVETTLASSIGASDTLIDVADDTGFPASFPFSLVLDYGTAAIEVVTVTGTTGSSYNVVRGQDGTAAQAHAAGAVVVHGVTARDLKEPQDHIDATTNVHGLGVGTAVVGTDTAQTLTNKTIAFDDNTLTNVASTNTPQTLTNKIVQNHARVQLDSGGGFDLVTQPTIYIGPNAPDSPADGDIWLEV